VYPYFLSNIKYLIGNHFKKNNILNIKKYNKLFNYKYNINLLLFSIKNKKVDKKLRKFTYFFRFLIKWYYFKKFMFLKKSNYSFYLLKKYYFFIFFLIRLILKMSSYFVYLFTKANIFKNIYNKILIIKILMFYLFYKNFLQKNKSYKKMLLYKKKKLKHVKLLYKKDILKKKKYKIRYVGVGKKRKRKKILIKKNRKMVTLLIGKKYKIRKFL
jgi:hypothetical protein